MANLEDYIRDGGIAFYNGDVKINADLEKFNEIFKFGSEDINVPYRKLAKHLVVESDEYLTIGGGKIEEYLQSPENLNELADFLVELMAQDAFRNSDLQEKRANEYLGQEDIKEKIENISSREDIEDIIGNFSAYLDSGNTYKVEIHDLVVERVLKESEEGDTASVFNYIKWQIRSYIGRDTFNKNIRIHVDADIDLVSPHYKAEYEDAWIINGFGQKITNSMVWVPEMTDFEKQWNFFLCNHIGGFVGSPGYEYPTTEEEFEYEIVRHAEKFMIGTKEQLARYSDFKHFNDVIGKNLRVFLS